ncbi:unnamed protein product [Leptidea sinapis]|uniref:Uncharacterized protein n=1 Tax=Leptidea sinapis TaxID=189913 RepID=A0A5E4PUR8_9NEOP|nr:unnamed protein product [Leptidea sinapis]
MSTLDEKLKPLLEENKYMKTKIEKLEGEIEHLKLGYKKKNVVVFGLKEEENSTYELIKKLKSTFHRDLTQGINTEDKYDHLVKLIKTETFKTNKDKKTVLWDSFEDYPQIKSYSDISNDIKILTKMYNFMPFTDVFIAAMFVYSSLRPMVDEKEKKLIQATYIKKITTSSRDCFREDLSINIQVFFDMCSLR